MGCNLDGMMSKRALLLLTTLLAASGVTGCETDTFSISTPGTPDPGDPPAPNGPDDVKAGDTGKAAIPATGTLHPELAEIDDVIKAFMRATCTGSVSIAIGFGGAPVVTRGYGYKAGPPNEACANATDPFVGGAKVGPDAAFRIGSNSKAITAAITRAVLKQKLALLGRPTTDAELESLKVFDADLDLVSPRLRQIVLATGTAPGSAGPCVTGPISPITSSGRADPRWRDITVGHLLGHRSGLPRGGNPVTSKLSTIRHLQTEGAVAAHSQLTSAPAAARNAVAGPYGKGHFIEAASLEELLIGNADLCFAYDPGGTVPAGVDPYSNFAYGLVQHIAEHVSGRALTAPLGEPAMHGSSLLAQFLETRLGVTKGKESARGIFLSQPIEGLHDAAEPKYRGWDGTSQNGLFADTKRPWCTWSDATQTCNGAAFDGGAGRFSWLWSSEKVAVGQAQQGVGGGVGLLAAEMPIYLAFMGKYWVSGSGATPFYGRERAEHASADIRWHVGELIGTHSTAAQFVGDVVPYAVVPRTGEGELDLASFGANGPMKSCTLPAKLDFVLATNQVNDAACVGEEEGTICSTRYMALRDVVKEALCKVTWQKVAPKLL